MKHIETDKISLQREHKIGFYNVIRLMIITDIVVLSLIVQEKENWSTKKLKDSSGHSEHLH